MGIKTDRPQIYKGCFPTCANINYVCISCVVVIYFFKYNFMIPNRNIFVAFICKYPFVYPKVNDLNCVYSKRNKSK